MLNELYTFAEPVQVVPFSSLKWGKFTLLQVCHQYIEYKPPYPSHQLHFLKYLT